MCVLAVLAALASCVSSTPQLTQPRRIAAVWTTVNMSNVFSDDYKDPAVKQDEAAKNMGPGACQQACAAQADCRSYTYDTGPNDPEIKCSFSGECWLRSDATWHPKVTSKCAAVSGFNGPAPPGPPAPPATMRLHLHAF